MKGVIQIRRIYVGIFLFFLTITLSSFSASKWIILGSQTVTFNSDFDEIYITGRKGSFNKLRLQVEKSDLNLNKVIIHYRHGRPEIHKIKQNLASDSFSNALNLKGYNRIIRKVTFYYNTPLYEKKKAKIHLYGMR